MKTPVFYFLSLFILFPFFATAQEHEGEHEEEHEFKHHRIAIMIGHTHVPKGIEGGGDTGGLIVPSWGLNYEYWFNENWAIGLHNDMEITTYAIERVRDTVLERERPFILALVGLYKFDTGFEILTGMGLELEKNENFVVFRLGVEYEIEIGKHWDIAPGFVYDIKEDVYNSFTIGLSVGKKF